MSKEIRIIKSPIAEGIGLPITRIDHMTINVMLPNGMIITNPEQFTENQYTSEYVEEDTST